MLKKYILPKDFFVSTTNYSREVLKESGDINNGIGTPILNLTIFLFIAWVFIAGVLIRGIRSSGKASYFLALFPYVIIGVLLVRAVTLDGAWNGILYFLKPRWDKILEPSVSSKKIMVKSKKYGEKWKEAEKAKNGDK